MSTELRVALRLLLKDRGFTVSAIFALALGIGSNVLVFTLVNGVFFRDLPFRDPGRLVAIEARDVARNRQGNMSYLDLQDIARSMPRSLSASAGVNQASMAIADDHGPAERLTSAYVSASMFRMLGIQPLLGRDFTASDDRAGAEPVVLLGYSLWQRRYGGDPAIIGRVVRVDGTPATIVGVMPERFAFPEVAEAWQPLSRLAASIRENRNVRAIDGLARLANGASLEQARDEIHSAGAALMRAYPDTNANIDFAVLPQRESVIGGAAAAMFSALMSAVAFLLLMACANVANLLLARAGNRAREMATRAALGATTWTVVRQLLTESLLLSTVAGALGLLIGNAGVRLFTRSAEQAGLPYWLAFPLDATVIAFAVAACVVTAIVFGLVPALHVARAHIGTSLNETGRSITAGRRVRRWNGTLVVVQVAIAIILLTGGALMARGALDHLQRDAGVDTAGLAVMRIELPLQRYATPDSKAAFYRRLDDRLAALPGMRASIATPAPRMGGPERWVRIDGQPSIADVRRRPRVTTVAVGRRYFETLGIGPLQGRTFDELDTARRVVVINQRFAERHFPGGALGQQVELGPDGPDIPATGWLTIVGIVPDVRQNDEEAEAFDPVAYLPDWAGPLPNAMILARSGSDLAAISRSVRGVLQDLDPDLPLFAIATLDDTLRSEAWPLRLFGSMFGVFALAALILASVGLYAVIACSVAQRTRDIGVCLALGAQARHVCWTVSGHVTIHVAIGVAVGFAGAVAFGQVLQSILAGIRGGDPATLLSVPAVLLLAAVAACVGPLRRAMHIDPIVALRAE